MEHLEVTDEALRWALGVGRWALGVGGIALAAACATPVDEEGQEPGVTTLSLETPVVGSGGYTADEEQSETVINVSNVSGQTIATVAFNDDSELPNCFPLSCNLIQYPDEYSRRVYRGASLMGWAYSGNLGASWTYKGKLLPPSGWAALWGDPAIGRGNNHQSKVFMANLAVPDAKWPAGQAYVTGSMQDYLGGACIARSTDGGINFSMYQCVSNANHFYDGGSIAVTSAGAVFYATQDYYANKIDVWRAPTVDGTFVQIADPFPGFPIISHPKVRAYGSDLYIIAQHSSNQLLINKYSGGAWVSVSAASAPPRDPVRQDYHINFGDLTVRAGPQFSFDVADASTLGNDNIRIVFTTKPGTNYFLYSTICNTNLACGPEAGWSTENETGDQFHPAVGSFPGGLFLAPHTELVYWSRISDPTGSTVKLRHAELFASPYGYRTMWPTALTASQTVCPTALGYWGDYQDVKFLTYDSSPRFVTAFSDSSAGCDKNWRYVAHNLHVSAKVF